MAGKQMDHSCPFCGGVLFAVMRLYAGKVFNPHLEAKCSGCKVEIRWPSVPGATTEELIVAAERRPQAKAARRVQG
jgi:uncharacterized Zn finger protein (UPF0148 family)